MRIIWSIVDSKALTQKQKVRRFLLWNTVFWSAVGLVLWLVIRTFMLDTVESALCFTGYAGYFAGWVGGALFLCRRFS